MKQPLPPTFRVFDRHSQEWPPGFKPRLTTPGDPLSMLPLSNGRTMSQVATESREIGLLSGGLTACGSMGQLSGRAPRVESRVHVPDRPGRKGRVV